MSKTFGNRAIEYAQNVNYTGNLPKGYQVLNPFKENAETVKAMQQFYHKFYDDFNRRKFIIGINPSRNGAGVTGVPFTDTKRLESVCGIKMTSVETHEVSSVFMYDMIAQYGGAKEFYNHFYINSPFPLAIVHQAKSGSWLNANYYDSPLLFSMVKDYMIQSLKIQIGLGLETSKVFVLGKKNADFIKKINKKAHLFGEIIPLEHPRYIQQYKFKEREAYIDKYLLELSG